MDVRMLRQTAKLHGYVHWSLKLEDPFSTMRASKEGCGLTSAKTGAGQRGF